MSIRLRHILLYLLIVSVATLGLSFSRFSTTLTNTGAQNGSDIVFSSWILDYEVDSIELKNIAPGWKKKINIRVRNWKSNGENTTSDYDQSFNLELETTGNLPLEFTLREKQEESGADSSGPNIFSRMGPYNYTSTEQIFTVPSETGDSKQTKSFILSMEWPEGDTDEYYKNEIDYIELSIRAVQAQPPPDNGDAGE